MLQGIVKILTQVCFPGIFHPYDFYGEQIAWRGFCLLSSIQKAWDEHAERKNRSTVRDSIELFQFQPSKVFLN